VNAATLTHTRLAPFFELADHRGQLRTVTLPVMAHALGKKALRVRIWPITISPTAVR
jgi:hypothetical protein